MSFTLKQPEVTPQPAQPDQWHHRPNAKGYCELCGFPRDDDREHRQREGGWTLRTPRLKNGAKKLWRYGNVVGPKQQGGFCRTVDGLNETTLTREAKPGKSQSTSVGDLPIVTSRLLEAAASAMLSRWRLRCRWAISSSRFTGLSGFEIAHQTPFGYTVKR